MKRGLQTRDAEMNLAQGREVIATIFAQSSPTRGSGTYTAEFRLDEHTTFLRWVGTMDGHKIESLEVIVDNEQGLIVERPIALRPYPALKLFRDAMYASLKESCRPMFGTIQRHSVTTTDVSDRYLSSYRPQGR